MLAQFKRFANKLNKTRLGLLFWAFLLVFFLIFLQNVGILPLSLPNLVFFSLIALGLALYRPGWAFLLFVSVIPLENVNLAPAVLGLAVRPYQLIGLLVIIAFVARLFSGKLGFKPAKPNLWDWLLLLLAVSGFASAFASKAPGASLKLSVIIGSFFALYLLARNYVRNESDLANVAPFAFVPILTVSAYGIWQNVRAVSGAESFEVMPGRPNATFSEPDWLGMFLCLALAAAYAVIFRLFSLKERNGSQKRALAVSRVAMTAFLVPIFILLFLSVSRSAWLGALAVTIIFLSVAFLRVIRKYWAIGHFAKMKLGIIAAALIALAAVYLFHLTDFQLGNRAVSTGNGLQKITVACESETELSALPEIIGQVDELSDTGCRHIDLEDIDAQKEAGMSVGEIERQDPNVNARAEIYRKSWAAIKANPILGIGWGSIGPMLGTDERGASLNSSNIFLEIWLGSGLVGLLSFLTILAYIAWSAVRMLLVSHDASAQSVAIFLISSWIAIVVPNLFNAGIMMAYPWIWLGISVSLATASNHKLEK